MRIVMPALAATALLTASPAWACQYTQAPEPVGTASTPFFAGKMMQAAATVDIAVASETRTAFGSDPRWGVPATTFHVIDRIKGHSPDRFTLLVGQAAADSRELEPMHWVDEQGRVAPFPYPVEAEYAIGGVRNLNSCHPGTLAVRRGESYLVYRDGEGRLLGRFALYTDLKTTAFPLVPAGFGTREGWAAIAALIPPGTATNRDGPYPVWADRTRVYFPTTLSPQAAQRWLRERDLRPYAVRVANGELLDETRIPLEQASLDLVERALTDARQNASSRSLRALARDMLATLAAETLDRDGLLRRHGWLVVEAAKRSPTAGSDALVAGFDLTGSPEAIARLRNNPGNVTVIDGSPVTGVVTIDLSDAARMQAQADASWQETTDSLLARLAAVAEDRPIPDAIDKPTEPEPDPFSYMDCIRFGREEATLLSHLPEVGQLEDLQVFADPKAAQCTTENGTLSCKLAPSTTVRVLWAGWEGGFRVNPRGVTLTANADGLQCGGG
ncbi:hypothetical protein [Qipengyuania sp. MTN3-11]|uniref:hypothetical protein n=1 Tax=Qipengyuania sp. MTN3-11 TaxID=3056557 RepID=UPI0036F40F29